MTNSFYHEIIENLHVGYAYHRIISITWVFLSIVSISTVNKAFETATGLIREEIIGKTIKMIFPKIGDSGFDWIKFYGEIALNHGADEIEKYSHYLNRWYRVQVYSPAKIILSPCSMTSPEKSRIWPTKICYLPPFTILFSKSVLIIISPMSSSMMKLPFLYLEKRLSVSISLTFFKGFF